MSVTRLPRELGVIIRCNGTTDDPHQNAEFKSCPTAEKFQSATILVKNNRAYVRTLGWGRGLRKGRKRGVDHCPSCMLSENSLAAKLKAERQANQPKRDAAKTAKLKPEPLPKKPRKRRASPSADTAPASPP